MSWVNQNLSDYATGICLDVEAFRLFLTRNKALSVSSRTNHLNFLRFFLRLLKLREQAVWLNPAVQEMKRRKLEDRLEQAKQTAQLGWLREEVRALKNEAGSSGMA